jgi:galactose mutarotase-like enzyme
MSGDTPYEVEAEEIEGIEVLTLAVRGPQLRASFAPGAGMIGCSLGHAGDELLDMDGGLAEYARTGAPTGIPFLHPWVNRLDGYEYSFGGKTVRLDPDSPLILRDPNGLPIHGLLGACPHWQVHHTGASEAGTSMSAQLDFGAHEQLMAGFPFAHLLRMDVLLSGTALTIRNTLTPTGETPVPVSFGFHPYLRLPDAPREQWEIELPVGRRLVLDDRMIPTGESEPVRYERAPLGDRVFDDGFAEVDSSRPFVVAWGGRELRVRFTSGYPYAQVYAPAGSQFVCFEPMTAPTNALRSGNGLQTVDPGRTFTAEFEIEVAGDAR